MQENIKNIIVTVVFIIFLLLVMVLNIVKEDTNISLSERRKLATIPELTVTKVFDKTYSEGLDKYTTDQFFYRDFFRKLKVGSELKLFNKKDVNNLFQYNGVVVKQEYPMNENSIKFISNKINKIKESYLDESNCVYYSIVPDKNYFVEEDYLKFDYSKMENLLSERLKNIEYINIFDCLELNDYYFSDTHWKQECLGNVVKKIAKQMKFDDRMSFEYQEKEISDFDGVYSGQLPLEIPKDSIKNLTNETIENAVVNNYETKKKTKIYDMSKLSGGDKYDVYLSGATPLLTINNEMSKSDKELIVFRDSFGSSLVPLFTEAYKKITVVDTRYIATSYLEKNVNFKDCDVLFIYSSLVINNSFSLK